MRSKPLTLLIALGITLTLVIYLLAFQVSQTEQAVVFSFGKPQRPITEAGFYWKWPAPIQTVSTFEKRLQVFRGKLEQGITRDGKNLILETAVVWRIVEPLKFYTSVGEVSVFENRFDAMIRSADKAVLGMYKLADLINVNPKVIKLDAFENQVLGEVKTQAAKRFGVEITDFSIERIAFPESTTQEVFNRMKAERSRIIERINAEADGEAREIETAAQSERAQLLAEANAKAKQIRADADAQSAQYYKVFRQNPDLATFLFEIDSLEEILKSRSTIIMDTGTSPFTQLKQGSVGGSGE